MTTAALVVAILALLLALAARAKAGGFASEIEDLRSDVRRRTSNAVEEAEESVRLLQEMLAQVADGAGPTGEMIREGRLWRDVSPQQGVELVAGQGVAIVDVRTPQETAAGMIPGALHIPIDQLEERESELPRDAANTLIYCAGGGRSAAACEMLSRKGFRGLHNLVGGMGAWPGEVQRPQ